MKDKLVKFHHKAAYYRLRKGALVMFFVVLAAGAIAIPVRLLAVKAQEENTSENNPSSDPSSSQSESLPEQALWYTL